MVFGKPACLNLMNTSVSVGPHRACQGSEEPLWDLQLSRLYLVLGLPDQRGLLSFAFCCRRYENSWF